jgi:hypothetical protein
VRNTRLPKTQDSSSIRTHLLELASSLDLLHLLQFQRDTYPDRESHTHLRRYSSHMLLISSGLVGQDIRHLDKIWVLGLVWWQSLALMAYEVQV